MTATRLAKAFGKAVKAEREQAGWSQELLADYAKLDRTYISGLERAVRNPTLATMEKIAEALGVPLSKLVAEAERRV